jgi:hypothetical protein
MTGKRLLGLGLATIAIAVSMSACGGGGGNGGGTSPTVAVAVQGAAWVAYQDGASGAWQTLAPSGGFRDRRAIVDHRVSYRLWRPLRGNLTRQT